MKEQSMNLVSTEPIEWASDDLRGFFGYSVHVDNGVWPEHVGFPAFTHEQMQEAARIFDIMGNRYSFEEYPHLVYDETADTWSEVYFDDMSETEDVMLPFYVDGVKLYALGSASGWVWGLIDDGFEYQAV